MYPKINPKMIISTGNIKIIKIFYIFIKVSLPSLVCISHLKYISVWTNHILSAQ